MCLRSLTRFSKCLSFDLTLTFERLLRKTKRRYQTRKHLDQRPISRYLIKIPPTKRSDCSHSRSPLYMGEQQGAFGYTITWSRLLRGPDDLDLRLQAHRGRKHLTLLTHTSHITCRDQTRILTLKRCTLTSSPQTTCPCTYTLVLRRTTQMCTTQITCREYTRTTTLKNHDWRPNPRCPIKIPPTR